ncbi:MAG: glycoside hydrolase family protein [Zoogloeaceae bacterium]|jgi:lysozyme|nr:glycoside hydrolase family protein [Zoogloeaceae bacterium]
MSVMRRNIAAIFLSAAGLIGIAAYEGYTDRAVQPVPGDKPTYGFGSTTRADGAPVRMSDAINPPAALALTGRDIALKEGTLKACFGDVMLTQGEYDAYVSLAYNVGSAAVCRSSIPGKLRAGQYEAACESILSFVKVQGRNCCATENKSFCGGICSRRQKEYQTCMGGATDGNPTSQPETPRPPAGGNDA